MAAGGEVKAHAAGVKVSTRGADGVAKAVGGSLGGLSKPALSLAKAFSMSDHNVVIGGEGVVARHPNPNPDPRQRPLLRRVSPRLEKNKTGVEFSTP